MFTEDGLWKCLSPQQNLSWQLVAQKRLLYKFNLIWLNIFSRLAQKVGRYRPLIPTLFEVPGLSLSTQRSDPLSPENQSMKVSSVAAYKCFLTLCANDEINQVWPRDLSIYSGAKNICGLSGFLGRGGGGVGGIYHTYWKIRRWHNQPTTLTKIWNFYTSLTKRKIVTIFGQDNKKIHVFVMAPRGRTVFF